MLEFRQSHKACSTPLDCRLWLSHGRLSIQEACA